MLDEHDLPAGVLVEAHRDTVSGFIRVSLDLGPCESVDDLNKFRRTKNDFLPGTIPEADSKEILPFLFGKVSNVLDVRLDEIDNSLSRPLRVSAGQVLELFSE